MLKSQTEATSNITKTVERDQLFIKKGQSFIAEKLKTLRVQKLEEHIKSYQMAGDICSNANGQTKLNCIRVILLPCGKGKMPK